MTTGKAGSMVRKAIKCGEQALAEEAKENGMAHQMYDKKYREIQVKTSRYFLCRK